MSSLSTPSKPSTLSTSSSPLRLLVLALALALVPVATSKSVKVGIEASWPDTTLQHELFCFVHKPNPALAWELLESFPASESEAYDLGIQAVNESMGRHWTGLMKMAVGLRECSPALEVARQQALRAMSGSGCDQSRGPAMAMGGRCFYSVDELEAAVRDLQQSEQVELEAGFEYPGGDGPLVQLVGTIGVGVQQMHLRLRELSAQRRLRYVFVPFHPTLYKPVDVCGYGVELAIKNMEYKAVDDRQPVQNAKEDGEDGLDMEEEVGGVYVNKLIKARPELADRLENFKHDMIAAMDDANQPLKVWEIKNLGVQTLARVRSSPNPLRVLRDISHNLPIAARSLHRMPVNQTLAKGLAAAEQITSNYGGQTFVSLNMRPLTMGLTDPFTLFQELHKEIKMLDSVESLGLAPSGAVEFRALASGLKDSSGLRLDGRSPLVHYLNNLESDGQYIRWPKSVKALLQPNWPGQMYYVRKNLITLMLVFDPGTMDGLQTAAMAYQILQQQMPIRVGVTPVLPADKGPHPEYEWSMEELGIGEHLFQCSADQSAEDKKQTVVTISEKVYRIYRFVRFKKDNMSALGFLMELFGIAQQSGGNLSEEHLLAAFTSFWGQQEAASKQEAEEEFKKQLGSKRFNSAVVSARRYVRQKGLSTLPVALVNGRVLQGSSMQRGLMQAFMMEQQALQQLVHQEKIDDETNIEDFLLETFGAVEHLHPDLTTTTPTVVQLEAAAAVSAGASPDSLSTSEITRQLLSSTPYFKNSDEQSQPVTMWVVADLGSSDGAYVGAQALHHLWKDGPEHTRISLLNPHPEASQALVPRTVAAAAALSQVHSNASVFGAAVLELAARNVSVPLDAIQHLADLFLPPEVSKRVMESAVDVEHWSGVFETQRLFCTAVLHSTQTMLVTNGRVVKVSAGLSTADIQALGKAEFDLRASKGAQIVAKSLETSWANYQQTSGADDTDRYSFASDQLLLASSVFFAPSAERTDSAMRAAYMPTVFEQDKHVGLREITVRAGCLSAGCSSDAALSIVAAFDPLSKDAQRLTPVLLYLAENFEVAIRLVLYPSSSLSELPLKNFYRYVLPGDLRWTADGARVYQPRALFDRVPEAQTLTLNLDTPSSWSMEPVTSGHDMDNIRLADLPSESVFAKYKIAALYVQGNGIEAPSNQAPRGLQLALDSADGTTISDTIVMANLGYFQLQAAPGQFTLRMVDGRSTELYQFQTGENLKPGSAPDQMKLTVDSFLGIDVGLTVKKREGKEEEELLQLPQQEASSSEGASLSMYQQLRSRLWGSSREGSAVSSADDTIHVFSLASGHLYERFLRIMMLSVIKNTKSSVKFWFLKNFLSAQFTQFFLPKIAKKHNIQYELVTYRWPSWLHQQTEKQRIIWGHKILFLDVMFPLSVKKIVYIDADQVVRGDLRALWDLDMQGAPIAMTPMCDSRKEVEGFRFWKQGFWQSHLAGKPYHISALFVVDLEMWRATAAGDQFRVVYEQLSKDKNSLANLDQDLPNYAQHQVPIFSLPAKWLWCGSWCSQESKAEAQTIDLCNDPLKKTPKLEMARAILPEWVSLDEEGEAIEQEE